MTDDPIATLRALAAFYRDHWNFAAGLGSDETIALADHIDGVRKRHTLQQTASRGHLCRHCRGDDLWPCPDVRELLAVAEALGITA